MTLFSRAGPAASGGSASVDSAPSRAIMGLGLPACNDERRPTHNRDGAASPALLGAWAAALVLVLAGLAACGGGGGSGGGSSGSRAGSLAISGINRIPSHLVKMSKAQMQGAWVIVERVESHANSIGKIACRSYVVDPGVGSCGANQRAGKRRDSQGNIVSRAGGSAPFTEIVDVLNSHAWMGNQVAAMGTVKLVNLSEHYFVTDWRTWDGRSWLLVHSTSNGATNVPLFQYSKFTNFPADVQARRKSLIGDMIADDKLIFVSSWSRDSSGNYIRAPGSSSCRDVDDGCLWTPWVLPSGGLLGTSGGAVLVSAAVASVLAVFPDTSPENLARFAKACARKSGNGIETLLTNSGGVGVADFNCMGAVVTALENLPTGGSTTITVGGKNATFSDRDLTVSFAQSRSAWGFGGGAEGDGFLFGVVPNGEGAAMAVAKLRKDGFFASLGTGTYDSFFGFRRGHGSVYGMEYALGHEALFLHLADVRSSGGDLIFRAEGKSAGLAAYKEFHPAERVALALSANFEKFLGATAEIPFGRVEMDQGRWNRRTALSAEYAVDKGAVLGFDADVLFPEREKPEIGGRLRFRLTF